MALAMTLGVVAAFATTSPTVKKLSNPNWQVTDASGNVIIGGAFVANETASQASLDLNCSGTSEDCAVTVVRQDGPKTPSPQFLTKDE